MERGAIGGNVVCVAGADCSPRKRERRNGCSGFESEPAVAVKGWEACRPKSARGRSFGGARTEVFSTGGAGEMSMAMTGEESSATSGEWAPLPRGEGLLRSSEVIDLVGRLNENLAFRSPPPAPVSTAHWRDSV